MLLNRKTALTRAKSSKKKEKKDSEEPEEEVPVEYEREVLCEHLVTVPKVRQEEGEVVVVVEESEG